jgi:hypothetical protein
MTEAPAKKRHPRFNHVAMSVPSAVLDERGRGDIVRFYEEVFGWEEVPQMTEDGKRLVLSAYRFGQFVFLIADEPHMTGPRMDHFGMEVDTMEDLEDMLARAKAYKETDKRVDVIDIQSETYGPVTITSFYVGYLLPMMVEVQHFQLQQ